MNLRTSNPYWLLKNGFLFEYPSLRTDLRTDCLILGGGITGALIAWHLAEAGVEAVVVDRRHIGMGSTCASTCLLQYEIDTPLYRLATLVGEKKAARSYHLCIEAIRQLEEIARNLSVPAGFERRPSLYFASRKADLEELSREYVMRRKHGIRVEQWSAEDLVAKFRFRAPGALYSPADGAQADAYALTHGLLQAARARGVQIFDKTCVTDVRHRARSVVLQTEHGPVITARKLVIASGYESYRYLEKNPVRLHSTYALVSEPYEADPLWHENAMIWETARPYLYLRTTTDRRVLAGGRDEPFRDPRRRDRLLTGKTRGLARDFEKMFPALAPLRVDFSWAGTFAETRDGLPYIGTVPERPNTYFGLGFGGNGVTFSQIAARIIRDAVLGKRNPDARIFSFERTSQVF